MNKSQRNIHILLADFSANKWLKAWPEFENNYLVLNDHLICGQLANVTSVKEWVILRREALKQLGLSDALYPATGSKNIINNCQRLQQAESITIWCGSISLEQLMIPFMVYFMRLIGATNTTIKLVEFSTFASGRDSEIMILDVDELKAHPKAIVLNDLQIEDYQVAWQALCADTPDQLIEYLQKDDEQLPLLRAGLRTFIARYPNKETGLLHWDWILLNYIKEQGPKATRVIGFSMGENEKDWVGDGYLWHRLHVMAGHAMPLILLKPYDYKISSMHQTDVRLTDFGKQVLHGKKSAYPDCPIDEWITGVHLCSAENRLWFCQDGKIVKQPLCQ